MKTTVEENIIEKIKKQSQELWETIQEAKEANLDIGVAFHDTAERPYLTITKRLFHQNSDVKELISFSR